MKRIALILLLSALACPGGETPPASHAEPDSTAVGVVQRHVEAFNRRDVDAMTANVSDDIVLFTVTRDSVLVEARGRTALEDQMRGYFEAVASVRSTLEASMSVGPYVAVRERAAWQADDGRRTARSLGVYEVRDGVIQRVWYFPPWSETGE